MICPICQSKLVKLKKTTYGIGYECRKDYFYLQAGYPICHYTYRNYNSSPMRKHRIEHRYLFYPFVIYASPEINKCRIEVLFKTDEKSHFHINHLIDLDYFEPNCSDADTLIEKLNTYLLFK
jgi:hypothetical protein